MNKLKQINAFPFFKEFFFFLIALFSLLILPYLIGNHILKNGVFFLFNNVSDKTNITPLITIDSLITSSTIAYIALMNYAPNSSGSSQVLKRMAWKPMKLNAQDGSSSFARISSIFLNFLMGNAIFYIILSVLFTLSTPLIIFAKIKPLYKFLSLTSNVLISGFILISLIIRFHIFNTNPYNLGANALSEIMDKNQHKIMKLQSKIHKNNPFLFRNICLNLKLKRLNSLFRKQKSISKTYLNPLSGSKNVTFLRALGKAMNSKKEIEFFEQDLLYKKEVLGWDFFQERYKNLLNLNPNISAKELIKTIVSIKNYLPSLSKEYKLIIANSIFIREEKSYEQEKHSTEKALNKISCNGNHWVLYQTDCLECNDKAALNSKLDMLKYKKTLLTNDVFTILEKAISQNQLEKLALKRHQKTL